MNGNAWLPQHTALMELMLSIGCTYDLIAQHTGHCVDTVKKRGRLLGLGGWSGVKYSSWETLPTSAREKIRALTS